MAALAAAVLGFAAPTFAQTFSDLAMSKTAPATAAAGTDIVYTLIVNNLGPDAASDTQVRDQLPAEVTFVSAPGCSIGPGGPNGTVTCLPGGLAAGASATFTVTVHIIPGTAPGTFITNVATSSNPTDPFDENDTASAVTMVSGGTSADLFVSKSGPATVQPNQNITYTVTVGNTGPNAAAAAQLTDTLPGNLTFVSLSSPGGWSCTTPAVGSGGTVTCTNPSLAAGGNAVFTLTAHVPSGTAPDTVYDNTATVSTTTPDPTPENNTTTATTLVVAAATDLTIAKTHSGNAQQGQIGFNYTITVSNVGTVTSAGTVTVTDALSPSMSATAISGPGWSCTLATTTCTRSDALAAGASYPGVTLTVNVAATAPPTVINTATVANAGDTNPGNDIAADTTTVDPGNPDLAIAKTHSGNAQQGQIGFPYTITVSNVGIGPTSGTVTVIDALPPSMTATAMGGTGWSCTLATTTCTRSDALAAGAAYPIITLTVNVAASAPSSVTNTATVSGGGETNTANDTASDPTTVGPAAPDLTIAKTHSGNAVQGQIGFAYTITVSNVGVLASSGAVTVADAVPTGMTATAISGSGWSCTLATTTCTRSDALAAGTAYPVITLTVNVAASAPSSVTNTATVSGGGETNTANDTASDPTTVTPNAPDLAIAKTHSGNAQQGQSGFAYTITVSNVGAVASSGAVTVTDAVPTGMTATAISGPGWTCTLATTTCTRSDALAGGAAYPVITLTVSVAATAPSSVTNTATVAGGGDANSANNTASDPTNVGPQAADLTIAKTHSGSARQGQRAFSYVITVSNVGVAASTGTVMVTDTLPTGMTATAISGGGWSCAVGAAPSCTRADALAAGAAYPAITLTVSVATDAPASVTNTATVSGGGDANAANNSASDPTTVVAGPVARNFVFSIPAGTSKSVDLTSGATGGPFTGATIVSFTPSGAGSVTVTPSGGSFILTFTPAPLFTGTVVISYTLSTATATSAPATVTITVVPRRDPSKDPDVVGLINAQVAVSERFANAQMMNFNQRLETLHADGYGQDQQGIGFASADDPRTPNAHVAEAFADLPGATSYADASRPASPSKKVFDQVFKAEPMAKKGDPGAGGARRDYSFWSSGYVNFGSANDVIPGSGFDFTTSGVSIGADYRFTPKLTAGIGLGFGRDHTRIGLNGTESRAQTYSITAYETYRPWRHVFIDALLGYGTLKFDSQRFVVDNSDFAFGSRNGAEWFGSLTAGYEFRSNRLLLSPYSRIKAVWLTLDAFTETGDPTGSLLFGKQNVDTYTGVLGLRGKYDIPMDFAVLSPRFRLEYNHAFQNGGVAALAYADWIGGPTYFVPAVATTSDFATIGLGLDVKFPSATFVNFDYQTMVNAFDTRSHMFQLKAGRKF